MELKEAEAKSLQESERLEKEIADVQEISVSNLKKQILLYEVCRVCCVFLFELKISDIMIMVVSMCWCKSEKAQHHDCR